MTLDYLALATLTAALLVMALWFPTQVSRHGPFADLERHYDGRERRRG